MTFRFALLLLCLAAPLAHAQAEAEEDTVAEIYTAKCKYCHGPNGKASTVVAKKEKIPDMTTPAWQKAWSDADIRQIITQGSPKNPKMKAYKDKLTPQQIDALVAYVRGFKQGD